MSRRVFLRPNNVQRTVTLTAAAIALGTCVAARSAAPSEAANPAAVKAGVLPKATPAKSAARPKARRAAAARYVAQCSWDNPGLRPFTGDVVAAVDRYRDIPLAVRARLKERMAERQYDEFVEIRRDAIVGQRDYEPGIREMHFGDNRVCGTITRTKWTDKMLERGMVYCEGEHCILVPTVCRNVSRIRRKPVTAGPAPEQPGLPGEGVPAAPGLPAGGGYELYGWLTVQARGVEEPGWVWRRAPGVEPAVPFLPPFTGGPVFTERPLPETALPVPEAPTWLMLGVGALVVLGWSRRATSPGRKD